MKRGLSMYNVCVIGIGQLGRRHIEGLFKSNNNIRVFAYDLAFDELQKWCINFIKSHENSNATIAKVKCLNDLEKVSFDLVIVATNALDRPKFLINYMSILTSKYWLIEKPLSQSNSGLAELTRLSQVKNCWVNHWRRDTTMYKNLKTHFLKPKAIDVVVSGPNLGIACNISHFVDIVNFLNGETPKTVNTSELEKNWHPSKRQGFFDIDGILNIEFDKGSTLKVISNSDLSKYEITIDGKNLRAKNIKINEVEGAIHVGYDYHSGLKVPFQSQMTGKILDDLMTRGTCDLTPLEIAISCHRPLVKALLQHWNTSTQEKEVEAVPFT